MPVSCDDRVPMLLEKLGFTEIGPMSGGVYHLENKLSKGSASAEYIALLYSPAPISSETKLIQLFVQRVPDPLPIDMTPTQIQIHWQNLDARRLEESGLEPITIDLPTDEQWNQLPMVEYVRPSETRRIRHCVQLPTGDVVCYN
ncbi:hypothetical protein [Pseudoduganella sp. HUAS MS19]